MECSITLYLDIRRPRKSGIYIVRIRVYSGALARTEHYSTNVKLTQAEFELCTCRNPKGKYIAIAQTLNQLKNDAIEKAKDIIPFSFERFEEIMYETPRNKTNVFDAFEIAINDNKSHGHLGNADNYQNSLNSIKKFVLTQKKENC